MVVFGVCAVAISNTATEQAAVSQSSEVTATIKTPFVITFVHDTPDAFGKIKGVMFIGTKVVVKEQKGTFWLVENKNELKGYVFKSWVNTDKKSFNREYDHVYVEGTNATSSGKPRAYFQYNGDGTVRYFTTTPDIISVDSETGVVTAKKTGKATLCARVGIKTESIPIYCIYKWKKPWTGETTGPTTIYSGPSSSTTKVFTVPNNWNFYVEGDDGTDDGWAYGYANYNQKEHWGFVKINNISTKCTVSQYKRMDFRWPVYDLNIKKISSPFGPRSSKNGGNHKGFDIVANSSGAIEGESIVSSYSGTVKRIYVDNNKSTSHGNSVVITTDKIDPISGKNLTIIYMHLSRWEANSSGNIVVNGKILKEGDSVNKGQIIGHAGNTGYNTTAAHLHFEVNNQNAAIRKGSENPFTETINPIYFYMDMDESITKSDICEAASNGNGFYWYGENA